MKKLVPVLMVALAAVAIAAIHFFQELSDVRAQAGELRTHITELQTARIAVAANPAAPIPELAAGQPAAATAAGATPTQPAGAPAAAGADPKAAEAQGLEAVIGQMFGSAEGRDMLKSQVRLTLPRQYPDLAKELGLTPAEAEKFFDLLANQQMAQTDMGLDVMSGNLPRDPAAMQEMQRKAQEAERASQAELNAMLGDKQPKWQEYQRTLPQRRQVSQLQSALGTGSNALSDSQSKQLMNALAAEQAQIQQERRAAPRQPQQGPRDPQAAMEQQIAQSEEANRRMISAASSYLNPQQLASYRQMLEQQQNLQSTLMRSIGSQLAPPANGNTQPAAPGR